MSVNDFENERERLLSGTHCENTKRQEKQFMDHLSKFLRTKEVSLDCVVSRGEEHFDGILEEYFCLSRKSNGEKMKTGTLSASKYALNRCFKAKYNWDITDKARFPKSKKLFAGIVKDLKRNGLGCVKHYEDISKNDVENICSTLKRSVPQQLQWLLFFFIQFFFCRRGRENIEKFTTATF